MAPIERDEKFQFRMSSEERRMLDAIADREGLSPSDKLRQLIRREHAEGAMPIPGDVLIVDGEAFPFDKIEPDGTICFAHRRGKGSRGSASFHHYRRSDLKLKQPHVWVVARKRSK